VFNSVQELQATRDALKTMWQSGIPSFMPDDRQWHIWLSFHTEAALLRAILKTTAKFNALDGQMDGNYLQRYCSSVANSSHGIV
jgi:hypothetical protein